MQNFDKYTFSLLDIVQTIKVSYKKILLLGFCGLLVAVTFTYALGQYTASIMLLNRSQLGIDKFLYLKLSLPRLVQEVANVNDSRLGSEDLWHSAITAIPLIKKSDTKNFNDPTFLKSMGSRIYAIEVIGIADTKQLAAERVQEIYSFFMNGAIFIDLRDLVYKYLDIINTANITLNNKTQILELENFYLNERIKKLTELKKQYSSDGSSQIINSKDIEAKYLPISAQIIAATINQFDNNELLLKYKREAAQIRLYSLFVEKAKLLMGTSFNDPKLIANLFDIVAKLSKETDIDYEKLILTRIYSDLKNIEDFKLLDLPQLGSINITGPSYLKNSAIGLAVGVIIGILLALGLVAAQRPRAETKSVVQ